MYIIAKNHDYYDTALAGGVDKTIIYERREVDRVLPNVPEMCRATPLSDFESVIIGFCGKVYRGLHFDEVIFSTDYRNPKRKLEGRTFWSYDEILSDPTFMKIYGESLDKTDHYASLRRWRGWGVFRGTLRASLKSFFEDNGTDKFESLFQDQKVAVFRAAYFFRDPKGQDLKSGNFVMQLNPVLKDFEFYKVADPYTAMQEIMMYISGVLGSPNRPMLEISDTDLLEGKGFDKKISFRKAPSKEEKRRRRRKNG